MLMIKRILTILYTAAMILTVMIPVRACDDDLSEYYVTHILFGANADRYTSRENTRLLMDALYLCSEQADGQGEDALASVNEKTSSAIRPESIDLKTPSLMERMHNDWDNRTDFSGTKKESRKNLLRHTVNQVFDFSAQDNFLGETMGKDDSFSAFLYYSHILADYLSNNPADSEVVLNNTRIRGYTGNACVVVNGNRANFTEEEKAGTEYFRKYSSPDSLGRIGAAFVNTDYDHVSLIGKRARISEIIPTGWNYDFYPDQVNTNPANLYNRCHLVAHKLDGNDTETNLITGTRYLNETGMQKYEDDTFNYVRNGKGRVLYRTTPVYEGDNLVASGVTIEGYSTEDNGALEFHVYCYNVQPGISINYSDGTSANADVMCGETNTIPFALPNADETRRDLIFEMKKHMELLFEDQKNTDLYQNMMGEIDALAWNARLDAGNSNKARAYVKLKEHEYDFCRILETYVPQLLQREKFFMSAFR